MAGSGGFTATQVYLDIEERPKRNRVTPTPEGLGVYPANPYRKTIG